MKKNKLAITSFCDKTLFKPTASPSTGSGGPCNEHKQKAKSCGLNYEILMFHCFTLTISRINTSNALWFSDAQWQKLWQWWGSKMSLNHVEPCWTMLNHVEPCWTMLNHVEPCWTMLNHVEPFHFATQLLTAWKDLVQTLRLPRQLQTAARLQILPPAESKAQGIQRYCMQNLNVSMYGCWTKILYPGYGHSSRIKILLSRNFSELHVYRSRGPCWPTTPLMKIRSPPAKLRQRITDHFLVAF